jgi:hypothetical protein
MDYATISELLRQAWAENDVLRFENAAMASELRALTTASRVIVRASGYVRDQPIH